MLYCWLQLRLNAALFPFTGLCNGAGLEKPSPCRRSTQSCWYILITQEQKQPPGKLAYFCQRAKAGGLRASHRPPPSPSLLPPMASSSQCVPFSQTRSDGYPGQALWPGLSWKALFCQLLPSLWPSQLSSSGNSSVRWLLLLTGVSGAYSHCHDLTKLSQILPECVEGKTGWFFWSYSFPPLPFLPGFSALLGALLLAQSLIPRKERLPLLSSNVSS